MIILLTFLTSSLVLADAGDIVRESVTRDWRDVEIRRNYTFVRHTTEKEYSTGNVASTKQKTYDVAILYGQPYSRLVAKDGQPLSPEEDRAEQNRMDKEIAKRSRESEAARKKRQREEEKDLEEERELRREIADAFTFQLLREEQLSDVSVWVIAAEPKPGYRPRSARSRILTKMRGTLWISKGDYRWVKVDAEVINTFSFGFMLLRLYPGTRLTFEQRRLHGDTWLPLRANVRGYARLALVKKYDIEIDTRWENYRRFSSESRIVDTAGGDR
jgi:hypothetical protein